MNNTAVNGAACGHIFSMIKDRPRWLETRYSHDTHVGSREGVDSGWVGLHHDQWPSQPPWETPVSYGCFCWTTYIMQALLHLQHCRFWFSIDVKLWQAMNNPDTHAHILFPSNVYWGDSSIYDIRCKSTMYMCFYLKVYLIFRWILHLMGNFSN